jgi:hypothetical protein
VPVQAVSVSGNGALLVTPCSMLVGTLAVPLAKRKKASYGLTVTSPAAAPFARLGSPFPAQRTASSA